MNILLAAFIATQAAQPPCGQTRTMESYLSTKYGEQPVGMGLGPQNNVVSILSNPVTGTFTVLMRQPGGVSCIVIGGTGYTGLEPEKQIDGKNL